MSKRFHAVLLGMLFVWVSLVFYYRAADGATLPRELVGCLAGCTLALLALMEDRALLRSGLAAALLLFLGWLGADALAVATLKMEALKGAVPLFLTAGTFFAVVHASSRGTSYAKLLALTVGAGALLASYGIWQAFGPDLHWDTRFERRAMSTLANPDYLAGYLVALFPPALVLMLKSRTLTSWLGMRLAVVLLLSALVLTRVFGAFIALGGAILFLMGAFLSPWGRDLFKRNLRFILTIFGICLIGMAGYVFLKGGPALLLSKQVTLHQRLDKYKVALEMVRDNPWGGIGLGQIFLRYPQYQAKPFPPLEPSHPFVYTQHIESDYLQFAVEGGLPGLALFLALLAVFAREVLRFARDPGNGPEEKELLLGAAAGMTALLLQSLGNFPLRVAPTAVLFGLFLAGPLALKKTKTLPPAFPAGTLRRFLAVLASLAVAVIGLRAVAASIAYRNTVGETSVGSAQAAARYGSRLVGLSPWNPRAWAAQGAALAVGNQLEPALAAYQKAVDLDPCAVEDLSAMADLKLKQGKFQEALDLSQRAEAIAPNFAGPAWVSAVGLFELKRPEDSAREFEKYLAYLPRDAQAWLDLGVCYIRLGRKADAVESWKKAHQFDPADPQAVDYLRSQGVSVQ